VNQLEEAVEQAVQDFGVPGLGLAVILDGDVALARGFGVRSIDASDCVDEHTRFAIGSVSKSFTAAAIGMLVDEGKLSWDARVRDYLDTFELFDPYVTRELTVRDLLTHRSGLERGDMMWYKSGYDRAETLRRVRHLQPSWSFRSTFGYQNVMYMAAGEVLRKVSGLSWDDFVSQRILQPLAMTRSSSHITLLDKRENLAASHAEVDGKTQIIPAEEGTNANPAGSIYSSAHDMTAWLRLQLGDGNIDGKRLLTSGSMAMLHTPQMPIAYTAPWTSIFPESTFLSYALGWFVYAYRGARIISHGGNIDGMSAAAAFAPELGFGVVALSNLDSSSLAQAVVFRALDEAVGVTQRDWINEFLENERVTKERTAFGKAERKRERLPGTTPSRSLDMYAGTYADPFYGSATVTHADGRLRFSFIGWEGLLEHYQLDSFLLDPELVVLKKYDPTVRFELDDFGKPAKVTMTLLGAVRMPLTRVPDEPEAIVLSPRELQALVGVYVTRAPRARIRIEVLDGALKATLPGALTGAQAEYVVSDLIVTSTDSVRIKGTPLDLRIGTTQATLLIPHQAPIELQREL
jgi:CubicO group peptidase (beta-lactamase class C family)